MPSSTPSTPVTSPQKSSSDTTSAPLAKKPRPSTEDSGLTPALPLPVPLAVRLLDVELLQFPGSALRPSLLKELLDGVEAHEWSSDPGLAKHVQRMQVFDPQGNLLDHQSLATGQLNALHIYKLHEGGGEAEYMDDVSGGGGGGGDSGEASEIHAARHWLLPSSDFDGLWESLIYDEDLKGSLLRYATTTLLFADKGVDSNLVTWNKVLLLHGPPGTGKTSLCSAFAQKLAIRLGHRYTYGQLIEINSHSLFSKWFSESGKLVQKMFETIQTMVDDPSALVCVLIDEVESLAASRGSGGSNEPSDAVRVVNAVLTQLDALRKHPNVLIFTTSNITGSIDLAFVDRADMKKYVGLPSKAAIKKMLMGSMAELQEKGLVQKDQEEENVEKNEKLDQVCELCVGFSGRSIRKLPFLAFSEKSISFNRVPLTTEAFFNLLQEAAEVQKKDRSLLVEKKK